MSVDVEAVRPGLVEVALTVGLLAELGEMTVGELAADLGVRPETAIAVLRRLQRAGVRRTPSGWAAERR